MKQAFLLAVLVLLVPRLALSQPAPPPYPPHGGPEPHYRHYQREHPQHRLARWYASESMRQVEEARYMSCAFTGQRWALDWELHYRWALRAQPNRIYRQVEERDRHLARCRSNKLREYRRSRPPERPY